MSRPELSIQRVRDVQLGITHFEDGGVTPEFYLTELVVTDTDGAKMLISMYSANDLKIGNIGE